jgi:putative phage-type endonuclease
MVEQGTAEWHALRCGKVTASRVADIIRKTKSGTSATRERYMGELIAERLTGNVDTSGFKSADMERGNIVEADAASAFEFFRDVTLDRVAFVNHPTVGMSGASPDRLLGSSGLVEIKCPATHTHVATLLSEKIPADYLTQMHWQMACTEREFCEFVSFDPRLPAEMQMWTKRIERDDARIAELEVAVTEFIAELDDRIGRLTERFLKAAA